LANKDKVLCEVTETRAIAFYLPQFHPIPENDEWWGPGFTEWANVAKAKPLFRGHLQPKLPADLGFYDLRVPEVRHQQAVLARRAGIESFCYWHYWFDGHQLLERPIKEVLKSGEPEIGFCFGWANESWTGIWHGSPGRVLIEQTYPGDDDHRRHFDALVPAFFDRRYSTVDGKPLFYIFRPDNLPDPAATVELWRRCAERAGLPGLYLVAETPHGERAVRNGFDGFVTVPSALEFAFGTRHALAKRVASRFGGPLIGRYSEMMAALNELAQRVASRFGGALIGRYSEMTAALNELAQDGNPRRFPCVMPGWDNTPRAGRRGVVLTGNSPDQFAAQARTAVQALANRRLEERLLFVKSWNEWAEGNYMEPDTEWGDRFIRALGGVLGSEES
jgi:hypothetical protein